MKNKGLHQNRFESNPVEKIFAKGWDGLNKQSNTLDYLLAEKINHPTFDEVSNRDRVVAATVVQWLGSPCGQGFLTEMRNNIESYQRNKAQKRKSK